MIKYWLIFLLFWAQCVAGQTIITGKVTDVNSVGIPNINIILTPSNTSVTLAFAITDQRGQFVINVKSSSVDSLRLKAFGMGFGQQQKVIVNKTQEINCVLMDQNIELKEVTIKSKPINKSSDTLMYQVAAFKNQSDRSIADLIKRLPGIEIDADGKILYQGNPINKYYIEGLDLLEGKYRLANENLPVDAVSQVEVIEKHQPIKLLNNLVTSERAALNIRLKNKVTTTGMATLGVGMPQLWEANVSPMVFAKNKQIIASYQTNNLGNNVAKQLKTLTQEDLKNPFENDDVQPIRVQVMPLATPSFSDTRWLNNRIHLGSVNVLKKLKSDYELKANVYYSQDFQEQKGSTKNINYTGRDTIEVNENKINRLFLSNLEANLFLTKNNNDKYLKEQLTLKIQSNEAEGLLTFNNKPIIQNTKSQFYLLSNNLKRIYKINKQVLVFQSFLSVQNSPQTLDVSPNQLTDLFNNQPFGDAVKQSTIEKGFYTHHSLNFAKNVNGLMLTPQVGLRTENRNLKTTLERTTNSNLTTEAGNDYRNDLAWTKENYYAKLSTEYQYKQLIIRLNTPINFYRFKIQDSWLKQSEKLNQLAFEPSLRANWSIGSFWEVSGLVERKNTFGEMENIFYGYVLKNYRTIERSNIPLLQSVVLGYNLRINYQNPINAVFGHLTYSKRLTNNNIIYATRLTSNGLVESFGVFLSNNADLQNIMFQLGKYFEASKIQVKLESSLNLNEQQQIINGKITPIVNQRLMVGLGLNAKFKNWADFSCKYRLSKFQNQINDVFIKPNIQQKSQIDLNFYPNKNILISLLSEYYINDFVAQSNQSLFADLVVRYTFPKSKIDLETSFNNITNIDRLAFVANNTFSYVESVYELRPRQFVQKIRFSF
jgi:hypothetical protein